MSGVLTWVWVRVRVRVRVRGRVQVRVAHLGEENDPSDASPQHWDKRVILDVASMDPIRIRGRVGVRVKVRLRWGLHPR